MTTSGQQSSEGHVSLKEEEGFKLMERLKRPDRDKKTVSKKYVPEGFESVEDFLSDMRDSYQTDLDFDRDNRIAAIEDKEFSAGNQWDPVVLKHREGLPNLVINSVPQFTAQLVGDWREDRNAVKVLPGEDGDVEVADVRASLIKSIEYKSRANRVYDNAFESVVQCGDGAFRVAVEYAADDVFDQDIFIRPIDDALSVVWDHMSVDPTGRDANHCFVDDPMPRKEFKRQWPDHDPSELGEDAYKTMRNENWCDNESVKITEFWRMIERDRLLVMFEDGSTRVVEAEDDIEELVSKHGLPVRNRIAPCRYAQMHLVTGFSVLEGPFEYKLDRLPVVRMSGRVVNITGKRIRYGLVRFMKDSVRLKNFWRSVAAEQLGYAPKAKWIAPESAVEGREKEFRNAHLSRDPLMIYNDDATEAPQLLPPAPVEGALLNEAAANNQDMKDVTGIHDASLGIKSNETSGRAIMARQREGDIASLTYYDNGNASILEAGDVINQLISQIYDGTRTIRIIGEDEEASLVKINDPEDPESPDLSVGKYDVAISTGASYTTRRVEAAQAMMEAVQAWPQLLEVAGDLVVKSQDWPGSQELSERLKKTIPPQLLGEDEQPEIPQEVQAQMQQMQQIIEQGAQQMEAMQEELDDNKRELDIKGFDAETKRLKVLSDDEGKLREMIFKTVQDALNTPDPAPAGKDSSEAVSTSPAKNNSQ